MNMKNAELGAVIQWMAEVSGKNFIVDPGVTGRVTVVSQDTIAIDQALEVFKQALELNGYSAISKGNTVTVVPSDKAGASHANIIDGFSEGDAYSAERAVHVMKMTNTNATEIAKTLKPLVSTGGQLSSLSGANTLVIADRADNIKRLRELVRRIDQSGNMDVSVVKLRYADAEEAKRSLQGLLDSSAASTQGAQGAAISADTRSNSLLLSGSDSERTQLMELLSRMDTPISQYGATEVVYLNYTDVEELVPIIQGVAADANPEGSLRGRVSVQASESTNALVLTAPPNLLAEMRAVVEKIDVRRRQVLLEALIVEVSDDFAEDIGVQWQSVFNNDGAEGATNFGIPDPDTVLGRGFTLGYFRGGSLRGLMNAFGQTDEANLLSTPSIVALNNEEAEILVGSNVPVVTGESTGPAAPTNDPFRTLERRDIGVSLKITPKINSENTITLDVLQEVENISPLDIAEDIVFDRRSIKTKVLLEDDEIMVLGGLIQANNVETVQRVPVLGYIPVLGKLFQRKDEIQVRNNLMVFIHPRILDDKDTRKAMTERNYNKMRDAQQALQRPELQQRLPAPSLPDLQ